METATLRLHRLTSYEPGREWFDPIDDPLVRQDFEPNDFTNFPWFHKRYPDGLARVALPRELPPTAVPATAVLAGSGDGSVGPDPAQVGRILHLSAGVVRTMLRKDGILWLFRAAGSAGGRFPLEVYLAVPAGHETLPAGVHWYHPEEHSLVQVGPPPTGTAPAIVVTGVPWRTGWRYRERGYRHVYWDAGTMLAHLTAAADSAGLATRLYTDFPDAAVGDLLGLNRVEELPVAVVALGDGEPALAATGPATAGRVDENPLEFRLVTEAQAAGERDSLGQPWDRGAPVPDPGGPAPGATATAPGLPDADPVLPASGPPMEAVILGKGSVRRMDPTRGVPLATMRACLTLALRGITIPHWVAVHDVDGLPPGLYRWPDVGTPVRAGDLRAELYQFGLEQGLTRDAAFVVISAVDPGGLTDHGYRDAQLAAGLVEGRLHLAAGALGAGASGMTFVDSQVADLLGVPVIGLIVTCVGMSTYRTAAGGPPGSPTTVRRVSPAE